MIKENATCCGNCQYFLLGEQFPNIKDSENALTKGLADHDEGACHINPPVRGELEIEGDDSPWWRYATWPRVFATDWCGSFKERKPGVIKPF